MIRVSDWYGQENEEQAQCVIPVITSVQEEERLIASCTKVSGGGAPVMSNVYMTVTSFKRTSYSE